jgi:hypothetical protein
VGLATLTLVAEVAEDQPLICIVDDAQWLDQASAQILGFLARRLLAEQIALICAARTGSGDDVLAGLPGSQPVPGKIEQSYARRLRQLPTETRLLVLVAAAEPLGDPVLFHRATETLGLVRRIPPWPSAIHCSARMPGRKKYSPPLAVTNRGSPFTRRRNGLRSGSARTGVGPLERQRRC